MKSKVRRIKKTNPEDETYVAQFSYYVGSINSSQQQFADLIGLYQVSLPLRLKLMSPGLKQPEN